MGKYFIYVLALMLLASSRIFADEMVCPIPTPSLSGANELQMQESEFHFQQAMKSLNYLQTDVYRIISNNEKKLFQLIREGKQPKGMPLELMSVQLNEHFYISYPNSLSFIKGTLLKYRYLYLREKLVNKPEIKQDVRKDLIKAKEELCNFISTAEYVD